MGLFTKNSNFAASFVCARVCMCRYVTRPCFLSGERLITSVRCEPSSGGIMHIAVFWVCAPCIASVFSVEGNGFELTLK